MTYRTYFIDKIEYNKELDTMLINDNTFIDSDSLKEIHNHYIGRIFILAWSSSSYSSRKR